MSVPSELGVVPTAHFASIVYGEGGVAADDPAEAFHEASRLYPSIAPPRPEVLAELADGGELAQTVARAGRVHDALPRIGLPEPAPLRGRLDDVVVRRRSMRPAVLRPIRLRELSAVLAAGYASRSRAAGPGSRPVPSAGGLYPLELYVAVLAVNGLERGVYHYHPYRHVLSLLGPLSWRDLHGAPTDPTVLDQAAALVVVTAVFWRSRVKYGLRGYRFALLEAGHLVQNLLLAATDLDLPALPLGGFFDRRLDAVVEADGLDEASVHAVVLGGGA